MKYFKTGLPRGGVIPEQKVEDYVGSIGLTNYMKLVDDPKEWDLYKSNPETQRSGGADETNTCTNQSICEIAERNINLFIKKDILHSDTLKFLKDYKYYSNGRIDLSESFSAKISNTNPNTGNSLTNVAQKHRVNGFVSELTHPDDFTSRTSFWREPTQEVKDIGKKWNEHFDLIHFWIPDWINSTTYRKKTYDVMLKYLKYGLFYLAVPVCPTWNNPIVKYCGRTQSDHAVVGVNRLKENTYISDSYNPYDKQLTGNYLINAAKMIIIVPKKKKEINFEAEFDTFVKKYIDERPLELGLSVPEFGSYFKVKKGRALTQKEIYRFMELREPYLVLKKPKTSSYWKNMWTKLTNYIKSI